MRIKSRKTGARCLLTLGIAVSSCQSITEPGNAPGSVLWTAKDSSMAAPVVADSTVYFGTLDHAAVALDTRTGRVRWRSPTGESRGENIGRNVLVVGRLLIVPDIGIHAFDRATGLAKWHFHPASGDQPGRFTISTDGTRVFAGSAAGFAYAIDVATGAPLWTDVLATDDNTVYSHPVTDRGLVFLTFRHFTTPATGGVIALDAVTGSVRWEHDFVPSAPDRGSGGFGRAGLWHDLVIAAADDGAVYALNRDSGTVVWVSPRPADERALDDQRPVAVVGDVVAVGSDRTVLTGLDAATGAQRWLIPSLGGSIEYEMGADSQYLYLPYTSLQISEIDPAAGRIVWTSGSSPGPYVGIPVADAERVYTGGLHGLYAIKR